MPSSSEVKPLFLKFEVIGHAVAADFRLGDNHDMRTIRATVDCGGPVQAMCLHQLLCAARNEAVEAVCWEAYEKGFEKGKGQPPYVMPLVVNLPCVL